MRDPWTELNTAIAEFESAMNECERPWSDEDEARLRDLRTEIDELKNECLHGTAG